MNTIRAIVLDRPGMRLATAELVAPIPGRGEAVVHVHAASVNRADLAQRLGTHAPSAGSGRTVVGLDAAGEVIAVGEGVTNVGVGDRVMAMVSGGLAERVCVPAAMLVEVPAGWTYVEAAGAILGLMTSHNALRTAARLTPGESVLVHAAGSGVGIQAVQLAAHMGARPVIATVRSERSRSVLEQVGAATVINVTQSGFGDAVRAATGGKGVDVVLDHVGGPYLAETIECMALGGRLVGIGRLGGARGDLDMEAMALKRLELIGVTFRTRDPVQKADVVRGMVEEIGPDLAINALRPIIDRVLPWTQAEDAHELLARNDTVGKVVLTVGADANPH
ncbi:NAD(P)H-quinone oxidoreductase [Nocardioides sp. AN3]